MMTAKTHRTKDDTQNQERFGYVLSWLFFLLAAAVFLFGCYAAYQGIVTRPQANVMLVNSNLSSQRQQDVKNQLNNAVQGNFFTADLHHVKAQVADLDWVKSVKVSRQWPNGIAVDILPRHAVARFGSERLMSGDGKVFSGEDLRSAAYQSLPLLYGPKDKSAQMMRQYYQINQWFANTGLKLSELSLTEQMTWFLKFDNGLRVIVDKENSQAKLFRLSQLLTHQLAPVSKNIEAVDLRYRNGMAISWQNGQPINLKALLKSS